jgi:hypothetical protein
VLPAHGRVWGKGNFPISKTFSAMLPPSLSSEVQTSKNFLFLLKVGAREIFEKMKENFSEFETSLWLMRKPDGN